MTSFFDRISAAVRGSIRVHKDDARDGACRPVTEVIIANDAGDEASVYGLESDSLTDNKSRLEAAAADLLVVRATIINEDGCVNRDDISLPVNESTQNATSSGSQQCSKLTAVVDCSERLLVAVNNIVKRYETTLSELNRKLDDGKKALEAARTTIYERDTIISEKDSALNDEKQARSASTARAGELESQLKSTEECIQEKDAEIERLAQMSKENEAQHRKELSLLRMTIDGEQAALKAEKLARSQLSVDCEGLRKQLQSCEQTLKATVTEVERMKQQKTASEVKHHIERQELQGNILVKERQHGEAIKQKDNEISNLKVGNQRFGKLWQQSKELLEKDFSLLVDMIKANPRFITIANVEDVLMLAERHADESDEIKRLCEERLGHFHNLLPASKKYELADQYDLSSEFRQSLLVENPSLITVENIEDILNFARGNSTEKGAIKRVCEERLRHFGNLLPLTEKYAIVLRYGLNVKLIGNMVRQNPRLITENNIEEILKITVRHPISDEGIQSVCEERLCRFAKSMTFTRRYELVLDYHLDVQIIINMTHEKAWLITAKNIDEVLKLAERHPLSNDAVRDACEGRLRQFWKQMTVQERYGLAKKYRLQNLERELRPKIPVPQDNTPLRFGLPQRFFSPQQDFDFRNVTDTGQAFMRGGLAYKRPLGCEGFALMVTGERNDCWLTGRGPGEWAVAYHGTKLENVAGIVRNGFDLQKGVRFAYGLGIYCSPYPQVALGYSDPYWYNNRRYRIILQVRVDPSKLTYHDSGNIFLVPDKSSIRPYSVCVFPA